MAADSSKMVMVSNNASGGTTEVFKTTFNSINPDISNEDFVACGNALGSLCRYEPEYFQRVDTTMFSPDQFDEG